MHVCICNNFNEAKVREVVSDHPEAKQVKDIYRICANKRKPDCGKCLLTIKDIRDETRPPVVKARSSAATASAPNHR